MEKVFNAYDKPYLLHVVYTNNVGKLIERKTNSSDTANRLEIMFDGCIYVNTRYSAMLRLYNYVNRIEDK
jgi:hypothetical protein